MPNLCRGSFRCLALALAALIAPVGNGAWADSASLFTRAESFSYSAANPLTALNNFLIGPEPDDGRVMVSRNSIEFGVAVNRFEFSLLHRNDYNMEFTPDTALFAYLNKNNQPIPLGRDYDVDLWANQYQVSGARLAYILPMARRLDVTLGYSHLYASQAVSGYMGKSPNGEGGVVRIEERMIGGRNVRVLEGDLYASYYYTSDPLFRRQVEAPSGKGYALDLGFEWRVTDWFVVEGSIQDLLGEIRWKDIPYTEAVATSDTFVEQEDGVFRAQANFAGDQTFRNFTQDLTRREQLRGTYRTGRYSLAYHYDHMPLADFHTLSVGYHWSDRWGVQLSSQVNTGAVGLKVLMPVGDLFLMVDNFTVNQVNTLGLGWNISFQL